VEKCGWRGLGKLEWREKNDGLKGQGAILRGRMRLQGASRRQNWSNCSTEKRKEVLYKGKGEEDPSVGILPRIPEGKSQSSTFKIKHVKCIHCCTSGTHTQMRID
jgi:hypothetical protein